MVTLMWFDGTQFPLFNITNKGRVRKNPTVDCYEAGLENGGRRLPCALKNRRKSNLVKTQERENRGNESDGS